LSRYVKHDKYVKVLKQLLDPGLRRDESRNGDDISLVWII